MKSFFCAYHSCERLLAISILAFACFLALALPFANPATSQTITGRILGTVRDAQNAAIVGAKVTITDTQRNTIRTTVTNETGDYLASDLQPSKYNVLIEAKGFNSFKATGLVLEVSKDIEVDAALKDRKSVV